MRYFLWIIGGALCVSAAFLGVGGAENIWRALLYTGIVSLIFILLFTGLQHRRNNSKAKIIGLVTILLIVVNVIYGWTAYQKSNKQRAFLDEIRVTIESGIAQTHVNDMLLRTLKTYTQSEHDEADLGAIFHSQYDSLITDRVIAYNQRKDYESPCIELVKASEDTVILIAYADFAEGKQTDFTNYDGGKGNFQARGILTKGGITYEREN